MIIATYALLCAIIAVAGLVYINRTCIRAAKDATQSVVIGLLTAGAAGCAVALFPALGQPMTADLRDLMRISTLILLTGVAVFVIAAAVQPPVRK